MTPHPTPPRVFHTERLTICAPEARFAKQQYSAVLETRDQLREWMPWAHEEPSIEGTLANLEEAAAKFITGEDYRLMFFLRDTETLVGCSGLHQPNWEVPSFEIGYWVRKSFAGQGYVTEAVKGIVEMAFYKLGANRLEIRMSTRNSRSIAVARRAGFTLEGLLRHQGRHEDRTPRDTLIFAKVRQSFSVNGTDPLRPMTPADLPDVLRLWKSTPGVGLNEGDSIESLCSFLERNPGLSFVTTGSCSEIVGAVLAGHDGRRGFLYHLAVAPSHRRQGFGKSMVHRCLAALRLAGIEKCSIMLFRTNSEGAAFWQKLGWTGREDLNVLQFKLA